jgi:hypothetical protein
MHTGEGPKCLGAGFGGDQQSALADVERALFGGPAGGGENVAVKHMLEKASGGSTRWTANQKAGTAVNWTDASLVIQTTSPGSGGSVSGRSRGTRLLPSPDRRRGSIANVWGLYLEIYAGACGVLALRFGVSVAFLCLCAVRRAY